MLRDVDINEISDGHFYTLSDMAKLGCNDCAGCSACCRDMGRSVILDPMDFYRFAKGGVGTFSSMLEREVELNITDGLILPNIKMAGADQACPFLTGEGRCRIHAWRPGLCRLFPLGRYYEGGTFRYILQTGECKAQNRYKVRIRKWLDIPDPVSYDRYITSWHALIREAGEKIARMDGQKQHEALMYILRVFYEKPWSLSGNFYDEFYDRAAERTWINDTGHFTAQTAQ